MEQVTLKQQAAQAVIDYLKQNLVSGSVLGVGSGSTVNEFIKLLPQIIQDTTIVSSSKLTSNLIQDNNLAIENLNAVTYIDYYVDGADEIDAKLNMIKGGGGALTAEKAGGVQELMFALWNHNRHI